jgi:hypothetical protein
MDAEQDLRQRLARARGFDDVEQAARGVADKVARELLQGLLEGAEEALSQERPASWRVVATKERTLVTTVGALRLKRRLYRDEKGKPRMLLDEELGLPARVRVSPRLQGLAVSLCSQMPFASAAKALSDLLPSAPKAVTLHRLLGQIGERRQAEGEELRQRVFEHGEIVRGERKLSRLFIEADGKWIHLQRTPGERNLEVKVGLAHEGWEMAGQDRWQLKEKQLHFEIRPGSPFWEGFSARLCQRYDLDETEVVVGGDGAPWIADGATYFKRSHVQLDRFHLARTLRRTLPQKLWRQAYEAACRGEAYKTIVALRASDHPDAGKAVDYILHNHRGLADYRLKAQFSDAELRSLGAAEGNIDKSIANRMCKRGMAWTKLGARRMTRVLEAERSGVLENYLPKRATAVKRRQALRKVLRRQAANALPPPREEGDWLSSHWAMEPSSRNSVYAILRRIGKPRSIL